MSNQCRFIAVRLLAVEDERKIGDYLRQGRVEAGFVVDLARNGTDGLHLALPEAYDLAMTAAVCWLAFAAPAKTHRRSF